MIQAYVYKFASLVSQLVKKLPAMQKTWVQYLGWRDPVEKGKATHSSISGPEDSIDCRVHGVAELDMTEGLSLFTYVCNSKRRVVRVWAQMACRANSQSGKHYILEPNCP